MKKTIIALTVYFVLSAWCIVLMSGVILLQNKHIKELNKKYNEIIEVMNQ